MKIHLTKSDPPLDRSVFDRFMASEAGIRLPDDYIRFLTATNGGQVMKGGPDTFWIAKNRNRYGLVDWFYPFRPKGRHAYNPEFWWSIQDYIPRYLFPVANDGTGNYVMLILEGEGFGAVVYADHELMPDGFLDMPAAQVIRDRGVEFLAPSFDDFMTGLFPEEERPEPF